MANLTVWKFSTAEGAEFTSNDWQRNFFLNNQTFPF
jgi:hypothetical protein